MNSTVAAVESFRFLGTTISQNLKWDNHIESMVKKAQQRLYFLRQLRKFNLPQALCHHRVCPVFIYNCLVWFSYQNRHQKTTTDSQDCWEDYWCPSAQPPITLHLQSEEKGKESHSGPSHPAHSLSELLPSGWRYRALSTKTARHKNSFPPRPPEQHITHPSTVHL